VQPNKDGEQKLFSQFGLFSLLLSISFGNVYAQSFTEFKRIQSESFTKFRDKRDTAFSTYLQAQWQEYNAYVSQPLYAKEKPKSLPHLLQHTATPVGPHLLIQKNSFSKKKLEEIPKNIEIKGGVNINYFGENISFDVAKSIKNAQYYPMNQKGIMNFFSVMAANNYDAVVETVNSTCKQLRLNDWGVYLLVDKLSKKIYTNTDEAKLFSWFIFSKLGYKMKVALNKDNHIVLLSSVKGVMYSTPNYTLGNEKFYVVSHYDQGKIGNIYTYKKDYPNAEKSLDFSLKTLPSLQKNYKSRTVSFKEYGKLYTLSYQYNQNLLDFMASYPQVDYKVFFNAPLEDVTYKNIIDGLKPYIKDKKASGSLNFLLSFVQKAFKYERDNEQFGHEKVMFADETLYYKASDCEDRAVLYARLVKDIFGIGVVGVKYKNHMSTALHIPMSGDSVKVSGERYVIADPTYINASLGENIPKYQSVIPDSFIHVRSVSN